MTTKLITFIVFLLFATPALASAAIAVDVSTGVTGTNPSKAITRGTGASNYVGVVLLEPFGTSRSASACTWGGSAMTQDWDVLDVPSGGSTGHGYMWHIINPASGAQTVTCNSTASYGMEIVTYSGVDQTTPVEPNWGGASVNFVSSTQVVSAGGALAATGTVAVTGSWILSYHDNTAGTMSARAPAFIRGVTSFQWLDSNSGFATGLQAIYMITSAVSSMQEISSAIRPAGAAAAAPIPNQNTQFIWFTND